MRAAVVNEKLKLEITSLPDPTPGPEELVLKVKACGICGSDLKAIDTAQVGFVMGHEFSGEIVALGSKTRNWRAGQLVTALPVIGCGKCDYCITGDVAHCQTADMIGVTGSPGGFAEYVCVSARETFALPEGISLTEGALIEPLAVARHAIRSEIKPGDDLLVIGAGPIGLAVIIWARNLGVSKITVSDPVAQRRHLAAKLGADHVIDPNTEKIPGCYQVVTECVGMPGMLADVIRSTALHGRVILLGACRKPDSFVPIFAHVKELSLRFSIYYRRQDFGSTIYMMKAGRIDPKPLISELISLDKLPETFEKLKNGGTDQCKVLVEF